MELETLRIDRRFCGPPQSGNGGYVCGRVAAHVVGTATVRLKTPPPLDVDVTISSSESGVRLQRGATIVAEGKSGTIDFIPPSAPSLREAEAAATQYSGFRRHPFPSCFVCGPLRKAGDGLRIFPGPVPGRDLVAAPWTPDDSLLAGNRLVGREFLWAALDCTSCFPFMPVPEGKAIVLGELTARIDRDIEAGEECVAAGWALNSEGRKRIAASAIYAADGEPVAVARAIWIEVEAAAFGA